MAYSLTAQSEANHVHADQEPPRGRRTLRFSDHQSIRKDAQRAWRNSGPWLPRRECKRRWVPPFPQSRFGISISCHISFCFYIAFIELVVLERVKSVFPGARMDLPCPHPTLNPEWPPATEMKSLPRNHPNLRGFETTSTGVTKRSASARWLSQTNQRMRLEWGLLMQWNGICLVVL